MYEEALRIDAKEEALEEAREGVAREYQEKYNEYQEKCNELEVQVNEEKARVAEIELENVRLLEEIARLKGEN